MQLAGLTYSLKARIFDSSFPRKREPSAVVGLRELNYQRTQTTPSLRYDVPTGSRSFLNLLILCILTSVVVAACSNAQADVPAMEQRAQALNKSIMCPVCPGESIDQSQVALAVQMRGIVDEKLAEGWSDERIRQFFVERYGPSVLLQPPTQGVSLLAWLLPPVGVVAAIAVFVLVLRHMRRKPEEASSEDGDDSMPDDELQPYYERIEASVAGSNVDGQDVKDG